VISILLFLKNSQISYKKYIPIFLAGSSEVVKRHVNMLVAMCNETFFKTKRVFITLFSNFQSFTERARV